MITKEQAHATSELLLQDGRAAQLVQAATLSRRHRTLLAFKSLCIGVMLGFSLDEIFSHHSTNQASYWVILCLAMLLAIVTAREIRRA